MDVRELVGSLTQARVQLIAAYSVIRDRANHMETVIMASTPTNEVRAEVTALRMDAQKIDRCLGVIHDIRDRYTKTGSA